jgi:Flp pilus assembly protein TadD
LNRAYFYEKETNFDNAFKDVEKAVSLNQTNSQALNAFAWILATCPGDSIRDGKKAVEYATKACELSKWKEWNCIGTLAAAYAEAGDFESAIKYEKQAINTEGISEDAIKGEQRRLKLFEQQKPTHEIQ